MKKNAAKIIITVSNKGVISLKLDEDYCFTYTAEQYKKHIEKYINSFNESNEIKDQKSDENASSQSCCAYITYYSLTDLFSNSKGLYKMENTDLKDYAVADDKDRSSALDAPTIHMTLGNIFEEKDKEGYIKDKEPYKRFARFMDSSIWNYYAPIIIKDENNKDGSKDRYDFSYFKYAILSIINNSFCKTSKGITNLYEINVTKEYADINERIFMQSKLMEISGHGKNVSPFLFHSEQKVKSAIKEKEQQKKGILNYKWRILLVDDHATRGLTVGEKDEANLTKLKVIQKELCELFGAETITTDCQNEKAKIYIECASTLKEAKNKLKEKKYEIILLDYLLGEKGEVREYGYELLKGIWYKENEKKFEKARKEELEKLYKEFVFDYKKGPDNRFYFMFISAFTTAVSERLLTEGWHRSEDYWYIGEGACPINTPYLFQYRLLHIMEKRLKEMGLAKWNLKKQEEQNDSSKNENAKKKPFACLLKTIHETFTKEVVEEHNNIYTELIKEIYSSKDEARQRANEKFQDVLDLLYHYKSLIRDTHFTENWFDSNESVLVTEFIKSHMAYEGVLEHLTQLVYLTAFGTVRQWPEMWEEYQFLKSVVGRIEVIEKYIFDLKNNSI